MLFIPEAAEDITRYYKNTFVKFKETGDTLFYIKHVKDSVVHGVSQDGTPFELYLSNAYPYEVDYVLPRKSYFQYGSHACLLQRVPAKQYQRGISQNNVSLNALRANGGQADFGLDFSILMAFVSKQVFVNLDMAVNSINTSVVLAPRFAFVPSTRKVYADFLCVGQLLPKRKHLKCFHNVFRPELEKLALDTEYKVV